MNRRAFFAALGGTAISWPLAARAQQAERMRSVGVLGTASATAWNQFVVAFVQRLRELGWVEGRNVAFEYRWAEGRNARYEEIATEFARLKLDVILTSGGAVAAAKRVTTSIPIVFAIAADPVGDGLVANLARPGGNVTGLSSQSPDLAGKRVELLREAVPALKTLGILGNVNYRASVQEMAEVTALAQKIRLDVTKLEIRHADDIAAALGTIKGQAEALYVVGDPLATANAMRINTLALGARLPTMHAVKHFVDAGGLMSYGPSFPSQFRRAADYVDKILHGVDAGTLPVEQPTKFDLLINMVTAKALGLDVSPLLLARADEVIE